MAIVQVGNIAVYRTNYQFVIFINDNIYGPFPATEEMYDSLINLTDNPDSEEAIKRCSTYNIITKKRLSRH